MQRAIIRSMTNGALAGLLAVVMTAAFGFLLGVYALSIGVPIGPDVESGFSGLLFLVGFLVAFWGVPLALIGMAAGMVIQLTFLLARKSPLVAYVVTGGLIITLWLVLIFGVRFPIPAKVLDPRSDLASAAIGFVFIGSTVVAWFWLARQARLHTPASQA